MPAKKNAPSTAAQGGARDHWTQHSISPDSIAMRKMRDKSTTLNDSLNNDRDRYISEKNPDKQDVIAKRYNKTADDYAVNSAQMDSARAVNELKRVRKGGAAAVGGELTPIPLNKKKK